MSTKPIKSIESTAIVGLKEDATKTAASAVAGLEAHTADVSENDIMRSMPRILEILLLDRTTSTSKKNNNIIWANNNYSELACKDTCSNNNYSELACKDVRSNNGYTDPSCKDACKFACTTMNSTAAYEATAQIKPELITSVNGLLGNDLLKNAKNDLPINGSQHSDLLSNDLPSDALQRSGLPSIGLRNNGLLIRPRVLKTKVLQKERTKTKAEVFTPIWVVKKQNDTVDENYKSDDLETYTRRKWLEIACGEAPYMATRYDMETGELIPIEQRVGFVDRKLARINAEISDKAEWQRLVELAYQASYGFEWNGDSLLLARENLLYAYRDYYFAKWNAEPLYGLFERIAVIISYNVFQMDGLKFTIPLTEKRELVEEAQLSMFDMGDKQEKWQIIPGKRVRIMNWDTNKMEYFDKEIKRGC